VQSVDILNAELVSSGVLPESNAPAFQIRSRWRVHGAVYHWGHVHSRTNEYQALYSVAEVDHNWKINGVEVLGQRRIVQPGDDPVVEAPPVGEEAEP
jgi:hypothetical protein